MRELPLSKRMFRAWLERKPSDDVYVGHACNSQRCPIALWLQDVGYKDVLVGSFDLSMRRTAGRKTYEHPIWIEAFIFHSDQDMHDNLLITKKMALEALDEKYVPPRRSGYVGI